MILGSSGDTDRLRYSIVSAQALEAAASFVSGSKPAWLSIARLLHSLDCAIFGSTSWPVKMCYVSTIVVGPSTLVISHKMQHRPKPGLEFVPEKERADLREQGIEVLTIEGKTNRM